MRHIILYTLQQLKTLNSLHGDLHITVSKLDDVFTVTAKDRDTFNVQSKNSYNDFIQEIKANLVHYPNNVTVNDHPLETFPYPDLARATITSYSQDHESAHSFRPIKLEYHTDRASNANAVAGGVLVHIPGLTQTETVYFIPGQQTMPHWQRADKIQLHPHTIITPEEVNKLTDDDLTFLKTMPAYRRWAALKNPDGRELPSHITRFLLDWQYRAQHQVARTLQHPNAPPKYEGHIFNHVIVPPNEEFVPYTEGSPLIIHGTPLLMDDFQDDNRQDYISIAHALYQEDHGLVPVTFSSGEYNNPPHHWTLTDYSFTHRLADQLQENQWCIKIAEEITLDLHMESEKEEHITVTAPFHLDGNTFNKAVYMVPARIDPDTLAEKMTYAYWDIDEHNHNSDTKENFESLNEEMSRLVTAALGDLDTAFQEELTEYAGKFRTSLPWPKKEISAKSYEGRITLTYKPKGN